MDRVAPCWPPGVGSATCHKGSPRVPGLSQPEAGHSCDICRWRKQVPLVSLPCRDRMGRTPAAPRLREAWEGLLRCQGDQGNRATKGCQAKPGSLESVGLGSDGDPLPWRS